MNAAEIKDFFDKNSRKSLVFESIDSTNAYLKANRQESGTLALALAQTDGHGQYGRVFESPSSGLYMSLSVDFKPNFPMTLAAANAVADSLFELFELSASVKWVNDIIIGGKKLCGILAESVFCGDSGYTVVGFGLNVRKNVLSSSLVSIAVSLEELVGERALAEDVITVLALKIAENFENELAKDLETVIKSYRRRCISDVSEEEMYAMNR